MCVQAPLQPLQDNLESATYETFEKDTTKYTVYQAAIHAALLDCDPTAGEGDLVVMVVGAGRGPLVSASLQVSNHYQQIMFTIVRPLFTWSRLGFRVCCPLATMYLCDANLFVATGFELSVTSHNRFDSSNVVGWMSI